MKCKLKSEYAVLKRKNESLKKEAEIMKLDMLGVSEVRWTGVGQIFIGRMNILLVWRREIYGRSWSFA